MVESKGKSRKMEAWVGDNEFDCTILFGVPIGTASVDSQNRELGGGLKVRVAGDASLLLRGELVNRAAMRVKAQEMAGNSHISADTPQV